MDLIPLSGYLTTVFEVSSESPIQFVDWGDGHVSDGLQSSILEHQYISPGSYKIVVNSCDEGVAEYTICVEPLVYEDITITGPTVGLEAGQYHNFILELTSSNPYETITFYASGSDSQPQNLEVGFWDHLVPRWGFSEKVNRGFFYSKDLSGSPILDNDNSILGYAYSFPFYYKDDMPGNPIIFATADRGNGVNSRIYAALEVNIIPMPPVELRITEDGINPIYNIQYAGVPIPYTISIHDVFGNMMHYMSADIIVHSVEGDCTVFNVSAETFSAHVDSALDNCSKNGGYFLDFIELDPDALGPMSYETIKDECGNDIKTVASREESRNTKIKASAMVGSSFLTGESNGFTVYPFEEFYKIRRKGESENLSNFLKYYSSTDRMRGFKTLWDYCDAIFGDDIESLGTQTMFALEKFVDQNSNIDTCRVESILDSASKLGLDIDYYDLSFSNNVKRIIELASIPLERVTGSPCLCNMNFTRCAEDDYVLKCNFCGNETSNIIREQLELDDVIKAGESILYREPGSNVFDVYHVVEQDGNDSYPLKELSSINPYEYCFFRWDFTQKGNILESEIDYNSDKTIFNPELSGEDVWYGDGGILEELLLFNLTKDLGLDDPSLYGDAPNNKVIIPPTPIVPPPPKPDLDLDNFISRVEDADGESLEPEVKDALHELFHDIKNDSNIHSDFWASLESGTALLLAGARTLSGALTPLMDGMSPISSIGFEEADYDRLTGLKGGQGKYLLVQRPLIDMSLNPSDNEYHAAVWVGESINDSDEYYHFDSSHTGVGGYGFIHIKRVFSDPLEIPLISRHIFKPGGCAGGGTMVDGEDYTGLMGVARPQTISYRFFYNDSEFHFGGGNCSLQPEPTDRVSFFADINGARASKCRYKWASVGSYLYLSSLNLYLKKYFNSLSSALS